jgi:hypothetical protein
MPVFLFLEGPGTRTHPALEACGSSHIGRRASSSCSFFKRVGVFAVFEFDATQPSTQGLKWRMPFTAWRSGTLPEFMAAKTNFLAQRKLAILQFTIFLAHGLSILENMALFNGPNTFQP